MIRPFPSFSPSGSVCRTRSLSLLVALFLCLSALVAGPADGQPRNEGPTDPAARELIRFMDGARKNARVPELRWSSALAGIAMAHCNDMVTRNFFSHTNPDGKDMFRRLTEAGIGFSHAAENIAAGLQTGQDVFNLWNQSPSHRKNFVSPLYTHHGIARIGDHWVHLFLKP
jgi:uncharacterized protein YkwD